jgi:hypothetical protein
MQNILNQFKAIAPAIAAAVKGRVTDVTTEAEVMEIIHEEILAYFDKHQKMAVQHMTFNDEQRATFAAVMYDLLKPLAANLVQVLNPNYTAYVERTGKTGALNFITNA